MWTHFKDMHSGGGQKEKYADIYIEAPEEEAKLIFFNRFGHNPERVTCTCCGDDYAIDEDKDLQSATGFERGCRFAYIETKTGKEVSQDIAWKRGVGVLPEYTEVYLEEHGRWNDYVTLKEYLKRKNVFAIYTKDIKDSDRQGEIPEQGYVWVE